MKDKGKYSEKSLSKISDHEIFAEKFLSEKSIERRKKVRGDRFLAFQDLPIDNSYVLRLQDLGIKIINKLKWFNAVSAYLTDEEVAELTSENFILKVEKVKKVSGSKPSNKPVVLPKVSSEISSTYTYNYGSSITQNELSAIPQVHELGISGEGVIIGLLDSGFNWENHVSLKDRKVIAERDFIFNDNETANEEGIDFSGQHNHGTSVFSILAGFDQSNLIGPAFDAEFLLAKTEYVPTETHSEEDNYAAALEWMDSIGVDITTSSLGYSDGFDKYGEENYTYEDMDGKSTIVTRAAEMAFDRGIVVITSAGNEGNKAWKYITAPGDGFNTLTVGAVSSSNLVVSFSSVGPTFDGRMKPEIVAMGSSLINARASTMDSYSIGSGTSFSAPIVAGVAGMLLSAHPHLTNSQVRSILMESGDNVENPDNERGYGLVSA
ncbi:MAG: S8 family serine peptidase, partial [Melioribacteraceae bacterium]|nr:S8 family serine peptidase [Melioribacteraceae bacterium]